MFTLHHCIHFHACMFLLSWMHYFLMGNIWGFTDWWCSTWFCKQGFSWPTLFGWNRNCPEYIFFLYMWSYLTLHDYTRRNPKKKRMILLKSCRKKCIGPDLTVCIISFKHFFWTYVMYMIFFVFCRYENWKRMFLACNMSLCVCFSIFL